ncbi:hypothetical protein OIU84_020070 [Salix udensis]|uniref:phytol kinase n=1 Tax=Salix udensis TaxID=889485 RepID=A0AAD6PLR5_9ROSI|nr:hypothetical protein OIU84_020070 [Salix udensis]
MALLSRPLTPSHSFLRRNVHKYTTAIHVSPPSSLALAPSSGTSSFPTSRFLSSSHSSLLPHSRHRTATSRRRCHGCCACWLAFCCLLAYFQNSTSTQARYFASVVPLVNCLRLIVHGFSLVTDEGLIKSVTREGNPQELLRGPLYYVLILIFCALAFWRESPTGVISLAMMCGGDGVADIIGRRFGSMKLPYNQHKSWAGSVSMFICGFLISIGMLYYYSALGYFQLEWTWTFQRVALVALVATVVESLPITEIVDDNITVPLMRFMENIWHAEGFCPLDQEAGALMAVWGGRHTPWSFSQHDPAKGSQINDVYGPFYWTPAGKRS